MGTLCEPSIYLPLNDPEKSSSVTWPSMPARGDLCLFLGTNVLIKLINNWKWSQEIDKNLLKTLFFSPFMGGGEVGGKEDSYLKKLEPTINILPLLIIFVNYKLIPAIRRN